MRHIYPNLLTDHTMVTDRYWMESHIRAAFGAMWAAELGVDKKDEEEALEEIIKVIKKGVKE